MDKNELKRILNLGPAAKNQKTVASDPIDIEQVDVFLPSSTVFHHDRWSLRCGQDLLRRDARLRDELLKIGDAKKRADNGNTVRENAVCDFHEVAFNPNPRFAVGGCTENLREAFLRMLVETAEYHGMKTKTNLHKFASEIATYWIALHYNNLEKSVEKNVRLKKYSKEKTEESTDPHEADERHADEQADWYAIEILKTVSNAVSEAMCEIESMEETARAFGLEPGSGSQFDMDKMAALYERIRKSPRIKAIIDRAGKFRRFAQSKQRHKIIHGVDEVVGVTLGNNVSRLLGSERLRLNVPILKMDAIRRFAEKRMLQRECHGTEQAGRGPILCFVDESGSMSGNPIAAAKAFALALAWVAKHQKRWCGLVGFSSAGQTNPIALKPGDWNEGNLFGWLEHFYSGGTVIPLHAAENLYQKMDCPKGKTDVIIVTDDICYIDDAGKTKFLEWKKKTNARVIAIIIGFVADSSSGIKSVADEVHCIQNLDIDSPGVGESLSI